MIEAASSLTLPSKTWLLGEYVVLKGGPGLMLGHGPYFKARYHPGAGIFPFHPESPAGLFLKSHPYAGKIDFIDPHAGAGGFGGSGAEFLSAWYAGKALPESADERSRAAQKAWQAARIFPGSGSDILTQAYGVNLAEPFVLALETTTGSAEKIELALGLELTLFHTGQKLNTHSHIETLPELPLEALSALVIKAEDSLRARDGATFADAMNRYGAVLANLGLLAPHSAQALARLPREKVLAAKGCGAMGADVIAVLHEGIDLSAYARENGLKEVSRFRV